MLKLTELNRDEIAKILANSTLPANQAISIINLLNGLEKVEESSMRDVSTFVWKEKMLADMSLEEVEKFYTEISKKAVTQRDEDDLKDFSKYLDVRRAIIEKLESSEKK